MAGATTKAKDAAKKAADAAAKAAAKVTDTPSASEGGAFGKAAGAGSPAPAAEPQTPPADASQTKVKPTPNGGKATKSAYVAAWPLRCSGKRYRTGAPLPEFSATETASLLKQGAIRVANKT